MSPRVTLTKKRILDQNIAFEFQKTLDHHRRCLGTGSCLHHKASLLVFKACSVQQGTKQEIQV